MSKEITKSKYEDVKDLIFLAQVKLRRLHKTDFSSECTEALGQLSGSLMWLDQLLLMLDE